MFLLRHLVITVAYIQVCHGVMCYWCSGVGDDRDCEQHPYAVQTGPVFLNCRAQHCLSVKVIDADSGQVKSFARLCDNNPRENVCIQDSKLMTCYESCTDDLCNSGNPDPKFLPVTNYASTITKQPEGKGLKGNIFGGHGENKAFGMLGLGPRHDSIMSNARERLLSNAFRGSSSTGRKRLLSGSRDQLPRPRSNKHIKVVTEAEVELSTATVRFLPDTKNKATIQTTPMSQNKSKSNGELKPEVGRLSSTTPITTLSLLSESTKHFHDNLQTGLPTTLTADVQIQSTNFKLAKENDVQDKSSDSGIDSMKPDQNKPSKNVGYTLSASLDKEDNKDRSTSNVGSIGSKTSKSSDAEVTKTTYKADLSTHHVTPNNKQTTSQRRQTTTTKNPDTEAQFHPRSLSHESYLSSSKLISPNNVATMEKPVTAIGPDSWDDLQGLETMDADDNTFSFNSHPRNPSFPKHKHKKRTHIPSRKVESVNGIVIWPRKEDLLEEERVSNSIFDEDKEEAFMEEVDSRNNSSRFNEDSSKSPQRKNPSHYKEDSSKASQKTTQSFLADALPSSLINQTFPLTKTSPTTPITTMDSLLKKDTEIHLPDLPLGNPGIDQSKQAQSNLTPRNESKINHPDLPLRIDQSARTESTRAKSNLNPRHEPNNKTETTTKPSSEWNHSTRQYASKLSDAWNVVKTTVIVEKHDDLPIPAEYPSFVEEEEFLEYPVFENEVSSWKDTTEDLIPVAGYQDEYLSTSSTSPLRAFFVIHVINLCVYVVW